ncbi:CP [Malvastrum leaf curl virus - [G87]]|uniref:Capsid protein n=1 Tax=Malvastrum leaf curl virus - [G87] TaxID=329291 RepID=Q2MDG9_9GEMI|nr:CP [Malvastrum leaf curl virus]CAI96127.1 CP [Malvastrum leaf curl virus - [G87]]
MSKRPADIVISTPASKVRRRLNFDSPYASRAAVPTVLVTNRKRSWTHRPMNRKPKMYRMYRSPDVPRGCEGPCKVQSFDAKNDIGHMGKVICLSDVTRGTGLTHRVGKRFCVKSLYFVGKIWMDENIKVKNHTNTVLFWIVRDRRPTGTPNDFQQVFNVYDNEPSTATVKNDQRDRFQVLRRFQATVTGGQYAAKEQAIIRKFYRVNNSCSLQSPRSWEVRESHRECSSLVYGMHSCLKSRVCYFESKELFL